MNNRDKKILVVTLGGAVLLMVMAKKSYYTILNWFLPEWESFSDTPYWDNTRYSWGYGTPAPGPTGTITEPDARKAMLAHVDLDYLYLKGLISRPLSASQWAALLSFSYNLGPGNADNLVTNINSGNNDALHAQWVQYINSDGKPNSDLAARRDAEWQFWKS